MTSEMHESVIIAGFGGQGVLTAGMLVCIAAMNEGKHVSHFPSYGAEMRGGTANCTVIVSDEEIALPIVSYPSICVVLNKPSLSKFESRIQPDGLLIYNSSLIKTKPERKDLTVLPVNASDLAEELGNLRVVNMIAIGALLGAKRSICSLDSAISALDEAISKRYAHLKRINTEALKTGFNAV